MQILKELADGARVRVTDMTHDEDSKVKGYRRIINEKHLIVYAMQRLTTAALLAQQPLAHRGRNNVRHPSVYRGA